MSELIVLPRQLGMASAAFADNTLYFYEAGTTTPKAVEDADGASLGVSVDADASGRYPAIFGEGLYKIIEKTAAGVTLWTQDNYAAGLSSAGQGVGSLLYDTIDDAKAATLAVGKKARVYGYYARGDMPPADYVVVAGGTGTADSGSYHNMDNGNQLKLVSSGPYNVRWWGAKGDGTTTDTTSFESCYTYCKSTGGEMYIPAGTYKVKVTFNGEAPVRGAGKRRTVLTPADAASYVVRLWGSGGDAGLGAKLSQVSITGSANTGQGLYCGDSSGAGFSNGLVEDIEVTNFADNIFLRSAIMCNFRNIWSKDGTYGLRADSEANVTTCHFDTCRFYTNDYGAKLQSGHVMTFTNCDFESSGYKNCWLATGVTSGPTNITFNNCWFEDVTQSSGTRMSVHLEMESSIGTTKDMSILFNRCVISAPAGIYDVYADYAQDVVFQNCDFSATADKFSSTKFGYATGTNGVRVWLRNCGNLQVAPTEAMYASMTSLTRVSGGVFGYFYEFTQVNGQRFTNYETVTVTNSGSPYSSLQVAYAKAIIADTSGGSITINSLIGGSSGQNVKVIKISSSNNLTLTHNGAGTEKIFCKDATDVTLSARRGADLVCHRTGGANTWYEASSA